MLVGWLPPLVAGGVFWEIKLFGVVLIEVAFRKLLGSRQSSIDHCLISDIDTHAICLPVARAVFITNIFVFVTMNSLMSQQQRGENSISIKLESKEFSF